MREWAKDQRCLKDDYAGAHQEPDLADLVERILDKGLVINADIQCLCRN